MGVRRHSSCPNLAPHTLFGQLDNSVSLASFKVGMGFGYISTPHLGSHPGNNGSLIADVNTS